MHTNLEPASSASAPPQLVIVGDYPPPWGGIAAHVKALNALALREGFAPHVLDVGKGPRRVEAGIESVRTYAGFGAALRRIGANAVVHAQISGNNSKAWLLALGVARLGTSGDRALLTVHSGLAPRAIEDSSVARTFARAALRGYRRVLCVNDAIASALERIAGDAAGRLEVLPAYVAGARPDVLPPLAAARARARFPVLLAAALAPGPQYGEAVLLEGVARLARERLDVGCLIYGPGTDDHALRARVEALGLGARCVLLGPLSHGAALACTRTSDVFVRPTLADGDAISIREALALGVRVVASDVGNRPAEVVRFMAGDPIGMAAAVRSALGGSAPSVTRRDDASSRIATLWRESAERDAS